MRRRRELSTSPTNEISHTLRYRMSRRTSCIKQVFAKSEDTVLLNNMSSSKFLSDRCIFSVILKIAAGIYMISKKEVPLSVRKSKYGENWPQQ